jgi:hypothetical protein
MTMVTKVTKIDSSEIPEKLPFGRPKVEEFTAVRELQPGEAIRFPCRWKHSRICHGYSSVHSTARRSGFSVDSRCRDGVVYVMRRAE